MGVLIASSLADGWGVLTLDWLWPLSFKEQPHALNLPDRPACLIHF